MDRALRIVRPEPPADYVTYRQRHPEPAELLLGSPTAAAMLAFLTLHPDLPVELSDLEWRSGSSHESVHRAASRLLAARVLQPGPRTPRRTVVLPASPSTQDLRRLLLALGPVGSRLRWLGASAPAALTHALVYGSIAAGTEAVDSDLDLLAVGSAGAGAVLRALGELSDVIGREIHVVAYTPERFAADLTLGLSFLRNVTSSPVVPLVVTSAALAVQAA